MALLEVKNVSKKFADIFALSNVNLTIEKGEIHSLVGENGAGKSTLINLISGVFSATQGEFFWEGERIEFTDPIFSQKLGIGTVHQSFPLANDLNVLENIMLGRTPTRQFGIVDWEKMREDVTKILDEFNLKLDINQPVGELSTANRQLIAIIKALSMDTKLIIMDEPTTALSDNEKQSLFKLIYQLKDEGVSILYISHELDDVMSLSDKITILRDGQSIETLSESEIDYDRMIRGMVGRTLDYEKNYESNKTNEVVLSVNNLSSNEGISDISFDLHKSEILGIGGLVGSGRTEILNALYGESKSVGEVLYNNNQIKNRNIKNAINNKVGYLTEDRHKTGLFQGLNVKENMTITSLEQVMNNNLISHNKENKITDNYIKNLNVKVSSRNQEVDYLSGGNQQKVLFARWVMFGPKLLLLDEPTVGVDIATKEEIYNIINQMTENGVSIILVSSDLPELLRLSDRIIIMKDGRISGEMKDKVEFDQELFMNLATKIN